MNIEHKIFLKPDYLGKAHFRQVADHIVAKMAKPSLAVPLKLAIDSARLFLRCGNRVYRANKLLNELNLSLTSSCHQHSRAMSQSPEDHEGLLRLIGVSQEYIDRVRKGAEERRAWRHANRGPTPEFSYESSETDFGDMPLSPPRSPPPQAKINGPDFSRNAWKTRLLRDLGLSIGPEKTGFGDYEVWKRHVLSEHAKSKPKLSTTLKFSSTRIQFNRSAPRKKRRSATLTSER